MIAIRAASDFLTPVFKILVQPPIRFSYLGAILSIRILATRGEVTAMIWRRSAKAALPVVADLALVINLSTIGRISLARASVVSIRPRITNAEIKLFRKALRWSLFLPNKIGRASCRERV